MARAVIGPVTVAVTDPDPDPNPETVPVPVPDPRAVIDHFASLHDLDTIWMDIRPGDVSRTVTVAPGMAMATYTRGADDLATLALAMHEAGHALFRAQLRQRAMLGFDPPRWLDEAVAAWAVRALEDPRVIGDAMLRRLAAARRHRREAATARLAAYEAAVQAGADPYEAWPAGLDPAAYPQLRDEPGVMASYAAADRWPRRVLPRKVGP